MVSLVVYSWLLIKASSIGNVGFYSNDRFDVMFLAGHVKVDGSVEGAVIGETNGRHAMLFGQFDHVINFGKTVEERIVGVCMEVNKARRHATYSRLVLMESQLWTTSEKVNKFALFLISWYSSWVILGFSLVPARHRPLK